MHFNMINNNLLSKKILNKICFINKKYLKLRLNLIVYIRMKFSLSEKKIKLHKI